MVKFYNSEGLTSNAKHDGNNNNQGLLQHVVEGGHRGHDAELGPSYEDVDNQMIRKKFYNSDGLTNIANNDG